MEIVTGYAEKIEGVVVKCCDGHRSSDLHAMIEDIDYVLKSLRIPVLNAMNPLKRDDFTRLENRLAKKLNKIAGESSEEIVTAIRNLIGDVDLQKPETIEQFVAGSKDLLKGMDKKIAKDVQPVLATGIDDMYRLTRQSQINQLFSQKRIKSKGDFSPFGARDEQVVDLLTRSQNVYVSHGVGNQIKNFNARSKDVLSDALRQGMSQKQVQKELLKEFGGNVASKEYWDVYSSAWLNKTRNWANLELFNEAGFEQYEILEAMDERTCPICLQMNGKTFSVRKQIGIMERVAENPDPDFLVEKTPWMTIRTDEDGNKIAGDRKSVV